MDDKALKDLLSKYRQGTCTEEELALLENWVSVTTYSEYVISEKELQEDFDLVSKALPLMKPKVTKLWPRSAAVSVAWKIAASVTAITLGVWLYNISNTPRHPELVSGSPLANDIAPGKNTATLTLANGKTINLSDAKTGVVIGEDKLTYSDGSSLGRHPDPSRHPEFISGSPPGKATMHDLNSKGGDPDLRQDDVVVSTPRGGTYQVTLPDGTKAWLNADSKITFPSQFSGKERKVLTEGEVYFEVTTSYTSLVGRRTKQSFIVETTGSGDRLGQRVEVLGTHFNINSYADEGATKTTLLEGSVRISSLLTSPSLRGATTRQPHQDGQNEVAASRKAPRNDVVLKPNQQATLKGEALHVKEVDVSEAVDWKNGEFVSDNENLASIMRKIARWYDVEVVYTSEELKNRTFDGSLSRYDNVSRILKTIEFAGTVKFKLEGRTITVLKH